MIRQLTQADEKTIMEYLSRNEIETSFLYANIKEFGIDNREEIRRCADYYGFFNGELLKGILPFYNLGSCIPHYEEEEAIPFFASLMKENKFEFLLGMRKIIRPLYDEIKDFKETHSYDESSYFINRNLKPFTLADMNFVNANNAENENAVDFVMDARVNGFKQEVTREDVKKALVQKGKEEEYIIAEKDGTMVAQACVQTYTPEINQIGSVYTSEKERGKGYCKATVSELCRRIIAKGKVPTLSVKKNNTPAVKAYISIGFEHYDDYLIVRFL
ncbi:GNAT family N-acetyltransferase [Clostridium swellfunianum]|uniref:GNAT family N-acetyltransferase n=1 Tax=Clostridium swellfunianum TaxID=1367462 RepID=UPI0020308B80|nr:GNAT family N-acetyltransferase [Clostridium swellfunianum]MCM0648306.1 GNAT family N-acetyltransferase [Clostridium swellfunianum]